MDNEAAFFLAEGTRVHNTTTGQTGTVEAAGWLDDLNGFTVSVEIDADGVVWEWLAEETELL